MSKIVISKTEKGICVSRDGGDLPFYRPGHTASAEALFAIFDELQVDGVAVIERGSLGTLSYNIDITSTINGKPFPADALENQDAVAADGVASIADRVADLVRPPFFVQSDKFYISGTRISDAVVNTRLSESGPDVGVEEAIKAGNANDILDSIRSSIGESQFAASLSANVEAIAKPAQIGEALAPHSVTNISHQVNHYGDQPLDKDALLDIIRIEIAKASNPGGALWSPK